MRGMKRTDSTWLSLGRGDDGGEERHVALGPFDLMTRHGAEMTRSTGFRAHGGNYGTDRKRKREREREGERNTKMDGIVYDVRTMARYAK